MATLPQFCFISVALVILSLATKSLPPRLLPPPGKGRRTCREEKIMATTTGLLHFSTTTTAKPFLLKPSPRHQKVHQPLPLRRRPALAAAYKVTVEHEGTTRTIEVGPEETILGRALEEGVWVPHDCKLGVCMTCPARLLAGEVDQSEGMLSDDVVERGYALLCASYPRSDCHIRTIPEDELLSIQLATAND